MKSIQQSLCSCFSFTLTTAAASISHFCVRFKYVAHLLLAQRVCSSLRVIFGTAACSDRNSGQSLDALHCFEVSLVKTGALARILRGSPLQTLMGVHASSLLCPLASLFHASSLVTYQRQIMLMARSLQRSSRGHTWFVLTVSNHTSKSTAYWVWHAVCSLSIVRGVSECAECRSVQAIP